MFDQRRSSDNFHDSHGHLDAVCVGESQLFAKHKMHRLLLALVDGNVGCVEIGSVKGIANGIQPPLQPGYLTPGLRKK